MMKYILIFLLFFIPSSAFAVNFVDHTGYIPDWAKPIGQNQALAVCNIDLNSDTKDFDWCLEFAGYVLDNLGEDVNTPENVFSEKITTSRNYGDDFPEDLRAQYCGSGQAKSTTYVTEYKIPTDCTNPLAITTDRIGNVWFAQTNTGKLAKFDPVNESFTEYDNPIWPENERSMMWGIDYSPDDSIWYTDETLDSIWKFSLKDKLYTRFAFPSEGESLPQKLKVDGSQIIVNDFTGNKITIFNPTQSNKELSFINLFSPLSDSVTGDFTIDSNNNLWYANWSFQQGGVLVKFNQEEYLATSIISEDEFTPIFEHIEVFQLPETLLIPNGIVATEDGKIWLVDISSSNFYSFDPQNEIFNRYTTSDPPLLTYGNSTGMIETLTSRPYWIDTNNLGQLIFNEQTANRIAVFDIPDQILIEYFVPSMNPNWGDCGEKIDCGLAQIFDFSINDDKIWFTEWVENNIGVVDTSIPLPFEIDVENKLLLKQGETKSITIHPNSQINLKSSFSPIVVNTPNSGISVWFNSEKINFDKEKKSVLIEITANQNAKLGESNLLIGLQSDEISISKHLTISVSESENNTSESENNTSESENNTSESQDNGGGCLIATATYGSELTPQVQLLRELRDNQLLQTESGTSFMNIFNHFYYSFSPIIADYERENPIFKEAVRISITPMISSLSILNHVNMNSETEVLGYGISLILLNIGMYVGLPTIVAVGIRNRF